MSPVAVHWQPDWVRPTPAQVADLEWLAHHAYLTAGGPESERAEGILVAISWVRGAITIGPATGRPDHPLTRGLVIAEVWAAAAISDGGGTSERQLRGACQEAGVRYYPPEFDLLTLEQGYGLYQALGWLIGWLDGWQGGRTPPLEIPARDPAGAVADDPRSRELAVLVERIRDEAAARLAGQA